MGQKVSFKSDFKKNDYESYTKLKLATGERALVNVIEDEPIMEYVHVLRSPAIGPDGQVLTEEKKNKKGELYTADVTDFVGSHLCFGDFDTLNDRGVDPDNCPSCKAALEDKGFTVPERKYAVHILKYGLQPNGFKLRTPFSVEVTAWVLSDKKFGDLIDIAEQYEEEVGEKLSDHDLRLSCINGMYQLLDIKTSNGAAWQASEETRQIALQTLESNRAKDLSTVIARRITKDQAMDDLERVRVKVAEAYGEKRSSVLTDTVSSNQATVDNILDSPAKAQTGGDDTDFDFGDIDDFLKDVE